MEYSDFIKTSDLSNHDLQFYLDGMNEENGEINGVFKRARRGDYGMDCRYDFEGGVKSIKTLLKMYPDVRSDLIKEIGDRHWYTVRFLQKMGSSLKEIEQINLKKIQKRKETDTLIGKGDNRENEL